MIFALQFTPQPKVGSREIFSKDRASCSMVQNAWLNQTCWHFRWGWPPTDWLVRAPNQDPKTVLLSAYMHKLPQQNHWRSHNKWPAVTGSAHSNPSCGFQRDSETCNEGGPGRLLEPSKWRAVREVKALHWRWARSCIVMGCRITVMLSRFTCSFISVSVFVRCMPFV